MTTTTQALDALKTKDVFKKTKLDLAVIYYGENPADGTEVRDAEQAAAELAQIRARLEAAEGLLREVQPLISSMNFVDTGAIKHRIAAALAQEGE
jgi:hypothetical protein